MHEGLRRKPSVEIDHFYSTHEWADDGHRNGSKDYNAEVHLNSGLREIGTWALRLVLYPGGTERLVVLVAYWIQPCHRASV